LKLKVRQPLQKAIIAMPEIDIQDQLETIKEELNVKELEFLSDASEIAEIAVLPNAKIL
jgi:isoleucyl-tRNA synthetase